MKPVLVRPTHGGHQAIYRFKNGYGASVIHHAFSYGAAEGLGELAVIYFKGEAPTDFELDYTTPLTDDVIGYLDPEAVMDLLNKIKALPARMENR